MGTCRLTLSLPPDFSFLTGQYLSVVHPSGTEIPLSIASAPQQLPNLTLHFQPTPGDALSNAMLDCLEQVQLMVTAAQGEVRCPPRSESLMVIAGGSGASLAFACAQHRQDPHNTVVLWCVEDIGEFYDTEHLLAYAELHQTIDADRSANNLGLVKLKELAPVDNYILSGSPGFVYAVTDTLLELGVNEAVIQSDVFAYAPHT